MSGLMRKPAPKPDMPTDANSGAGPNPCSAATGAVTCATTSAPGRAATCAPTCAPTCAATSATTSAPGGALPVAPPLALPAHLAPAFPAPPPPDAQPHAPPGLVSDLAPGLLSAPAQRPALQGRALRRLAGRGRAGARRALMAGLIPALALVLAGCVSAPVRVPAFRPAAAGLWSSAAFAPARIAGDWRQVAAFATGAGPGCPAGSLRFAPAPGGGGLEARGQLCLNGQAVAVAGPVQVVGPGRLRLPGMADWWVIWVDSGYRTLAVATPDGRFGFVLDRGAIPPDRLTAAAEIFDFNSYDTSRLHPFGG